MRTARIWTDDEYLEVDLTDVGELESAMRFKAEHITAHADPELFEEVAYQLENLWCLYHTLYEEKQKERINKYNKV